ncbi:cache domain-containing protein [Methylobacterium sp. E-025]|uniref:cache domain-containing protein n=1 Tax=Methylobacterium sp. E-025 TaxID=2836561 RepID=UPI001FB8E593|nr:cache domain-containing protein [Methylobacterium sp. E-025]MCJ2112429.1 cache domain-containing protein [Methylobacterium sp. E-025]
MALLRSVFAASLLAAIGLAATPQPGRACGDGEAPVSCGDAGSEASAKWMLKHVVAAIAADAPAALAHFTKGEAGFRTADTYVFCVGPDGVMSAHPNPILQGQNVRDLHDSNGTYFIRQMLETAKAGTVAEIRYLFPKPGSTVALQKTTYYTRAGDQVCGVGVYDSDGAGPADSPVARMAQLRDRLDAEMPPALRGNWTAFLEALNAETGAKAAAMAKARAGLQAAEAALAPPPPTAPDD